MWLWLVFCAVCFGLVFGCFLCFGCVSCCVWVWCGLVVAASMCAVTLALVVVVVVACWRHNCSLFKLYYSGISTYCLMVLLAGCGSSLWLWSGLFLADFLVFVQMCRQT